MFVCRLTAKKYSLKKCYQSPVLYTSSAGIRSNFTNREFPAITFITNLKKNIVMKALIIGALVFTAVNMQSQCVSNLANVYSFTVNNTPYELVRENKTWADAAGCAALRGGKLAEIDSKKEQDSIFAYLNKAGIVAANTVAPDGGGASYVWLGGNDINSEGNWFWDGLNMGSFNQFWQGTSSGTALNGHYTNWGNEPDNFNNQDGLGLAVTNWPLGLAGQWNDVDDMNQLYYLVEYYEIIPTALPETKAQSLSLFPNPAETSITVHNISSFSGIYEIIDRQGAVVLTGSLQGENTRIDVSSLASGLYLFLDKEGQPYKFVKH